MLYTLNLYCAVNYFSIQLEEKDKKFGARHPQVLQKQTVF